MIAQNRKDIDVTRLTTSAPIFVSVFLGYCDLDRLSIDDTILIATRAIYVIRNAFMLFD
jgi:hypothetical protein